MRRWTDGIMRNSTLFKRKVTTVHVTHFTCHTKVRKCHTILDLDSGQSFLIDCGPDASSRSTHSHTLVFSLTVALTPLLGNKTG